MATTEEIKDSLKPHPGYAWSTDYDLMLRLLESGCLYGVVFYDTMHDGAKLFDPCRIKRYGMVREYGVSARGISYLDADTPDEMKALCAKYEVQFLVPVVTKAKVEAAAKRLYTIERDSGFILHSYNSHVQQCYERMAMDMLRAAGFTVEG